MSCISVCRRTFWPSPRPGPPGVLLAFPGKNLELSPEQECALKDIDRSFQDRLQGLRRRLLAKRLEFKASLANPQAEEQTIRTKAEELRRLWSQCQQTTTDYYLKIRSVLTPEQRQKWFSVNQPCSPRNFEREP
ncbi:MAG: Spy/CpxP family protein refolding chaperone [Desulfobaccales bacterium]